MEKQTKKEKVKKALFITELAIGALFIVGWIACIAIELAAPKAPFSLWIKKYVWDVNKLTTWFEAHLSVIIGCILTIILVYAVTKIIRAIFKKKMQKSNRAKTIITLLDGFIKYASAITLIILVLKACGVNTTALIASVGVLTLVVGIGAQPLISDIIAGIFIIFENEYNVGEVVTIDGFRGTVTEIGIRSTKILDVAGNIKIINNADIVSVVNMSRELSLAVVDLEFPYTVPVEFIENLLEQNLEKWGKEIPGIVEGPYYKGVSYYGPSNVAIKLVAKCNEDDRFQIQRDLMREYRAVLVANDIDIAFQQVVLSHATENTIKVTKRQKKNADDFADTQREESYGIDEQNS